MRPSAPVASGMPTSNSQKHPFMGWWGDMGGPKQKGITQYSVSPFRQSVFRGALKGYVTNGYKRLAQQSIYFAVPIAVGYGILSWAIKDNHFRNSKHGQIAGKFP
ncbi:hypothetical protein ACM66B_001261 [Microbotryomycetes sp. NB124-2]